MRSTATPRRRFAVIAASAAFACVGAFGLAGTASAAPQGDPAVDLQAIVCEPEGSLLRPTGLCEVPGPVEGQSVNPYTPDGTSPGLLGLRVLGIL